MAGRPWGGAGGGGGGGGYNAGGGGGYGGGGGQYGGGGGQYGGGQAFGGGGGGGGMAPAAGGGGGGGGGSSIMNDFQGLVNNGDASFDYTVAENNLTPINALTPFMGPNWFFKARVLERGVVRKWENQRGSGYLCSWTLVDQNGTQIRATFFKEGVDKYYNMLGTGGGVFYFTKGTIKQANKRFSNLPHDYEVSFDAQSVVQPVRQNDMASMHIPDAESSAQPMPIRNIASLEAGANVDVLAVIKEMGAVTEIVPKTGRNAGVTMKKLPLTLVDKSGAQIELTLWDEKQFAVIQGGDKVMLFKNLRVGRFMETPQLSFSWGSQMLAPKGPEANALHQWWMSEGQKGNFEKMGGGGGGGGASHHKTTLDSVARDNLGKNEKPDYINVRVFVTHIRDENMYYEACPKILPATNKPCNKKTIPSSQPGMQDTGRCERCEYDGPVTQRYIASMKVEDMTTSTFCTSFDEASTQLFDMSAGKLKEGGEDAIKSIKERLEWKLCAMTLRLKEDVNPNTGEARVKHTVHRAQLLQTTKDWEAENLNLIRDIQRYDNGDASAPGQNPPRAP